MKLFHSFVAIVAIASIYSCGYLTANLVRNEDCDLARHEIKNSSKTISSISQVQRVEIKNSSKTISSISQVQRVEIKNSSKTISSISQVQRVFTPYKYPFPCFSDEKAGSGETLKGLIYIKVPKAASSTLAGINLRIAHRHVPKTMTVSKCTSTYLHEKATRLNVKKRERKNTILWTFIRDPKSQMISNLFFSWKVKISQGKYPDLHTFKKFVKYNYQKQLDFITMKNIGKIAKYGNRSGLFQEILDGYDFLGITERFDESLVALRLLLGLDAGDIIYVSAKKSGGYHYQGVRCTKIPPKIAWPEQEKYFASPDWINKVTPLNEFYNAVNRSLDLTIQQIGHAKFDKAFSEHKHLLSIVDKVCSPKAIFPCSNDGVDQLEKSKDDCYYKDHGCGYHCMDEIYYNVSNNVI